MPEGRRAPWKFFPRPGARLSVTFGAPLPAAAVRATLGIGQSACGPLHDWDRKKRDRQVEVEAGAEVETRIAVTELVQRAVEVLGRQVSGDLLTGVPHEQQRQRRT